MGDNQKIDKEKVIEKLAKILVAIFFMVLSIHVLSVKVPEMEYIQNSIESLDKSKNTVMVFSGSTLAASTAISLLPDDKASPLANTLAEMNKYFIASLCRNGIIGGAIIADDEAITYKTNN